MAFISAGYDGTVDEVQFANMLRRYAVVGRDDFKATNTTGDRALSISGGELLGPGMYDKATDFEPLYFDPVTTGTSRWDLVAINRDWQPPGGNTGIYIIKGGPSPALPDRFQTPGVLDDQPLYLQEVKAGSTSLGRRIDLRVWVGPGGAEAADQLALSWLEEPGAAVKIGQRVHRFELQANGVWGWGGYPLSVDRHAEFTYRISSTSGTMHGLDGTRTLDTTQSVNAGFASLPGGFLEVSTDGVYAVSNHVDWGGGANDSFYLSILDLGGKTLASVNASTGAGSTTLPATNFHLKAGGRLAIRVVQNSGGARTLNGRLKITRIS